ncbi:MAG: DNA gyrase C-terminal beta-propeller domain-containing protein, partial [Pseudomonadota bacterium]
FFSSRGIVYKEKVWRLPIGNPQSRGKFLRNMLPLQEGERITSIMPLPEDEDSWGELDVMFATRSGGVRRNKLSDFVQVNRNGKIAMKFDDGSDDEILAVATCSDNDDVLLTTAAGQCIRFRVTDIRVFAGRSSTGVRGISLADGDSVISMAILAHVPSTADERSAYLKIAAAARRADTALDDGAAEDEELEGNADTALPEARYAELGAREEFVLTVSEKGYGKRSSSYEFRVSGRGGKGIKATDTNKVGEIGTLIASFPVETDDQLMLVSDAGQVIRVPVEGIRFASRATKGVTIFNTRDGEKVVSVERISEPEDDDDGGDEDVGGQAPSETPPEADDA